MPNKRSVSLCKGQNNGVNSLNSGVSKVSTSPHSIHNGVTPNYMSKQSAHSSLNNISAASSTDNVEEAVLFLMRAAYGQEKKAKFYLEAKGIEVFLPMKEKCCILNGKRKTKQVSLIPNFLFVKSTETEMKKYVGKGELDFFHHYYVPHKDETGKKIGKNGIKPLVIPEQQMNSFIRWNEVNDDNKLFIADDNMNFEMNCVVKIVAGKFAGLEGFVCRIKGHTRVGVVISGVGTLFTAYIPKNMLEKRTDF